MNKTHEEPLLVLRVRRANLIEEVREMLGEEVEAEIEAHIEEMATQGPKAKEAERKLEARLDFQQRRRAWEAPLSVVAALGEVCREIGEAERRELAQLLANANWQRTETLYENPS